LSFSAIFGPPGAFLSLADAAEAPVASRQRERRAATVKRMRELIAAG
jgi:hypothetical protein